MESEPTRLTSAINAALAATIGVLVVTGVISEDLAGSIILALGAWIAVVGEFVRSRVTPIAKPVLTAIQAAKLKIQG